MKSTKVIIGTIFFVISISVNAGKDEVNKTIKLVFNLNGLLCAEIVDVRPLAIGNDRYEVECIEYRGGSGKKTYILDAQENKAWVP